jgi:hypothetical protein
MCRKASSAARTSADADGISRRMSGMVDYMGFHTL